MELHGRSLTESSPLLESDADAAPVRGDYAAGKRGGKANHCTQNLVPFHSGAKRGASSQLQEPPGNESSLPKMELAQASHEAKDMIHREYL